MPPTPSYTLIAITATRAVNTIVDAINDRGEGGFYCSDFDKVQWTGSLAYSPRS